MTKKLWQLHSWLGLIAGLGLLVIGVTGSLLVFRNEIDGLLSPEMMVVEPTKEGRLSWDELYAAATRAWPNHVVTGFGPRSQPDMADLVYIKERGKHDYLVGTLNPYTGAALCSPLNANLTFTGLLLELHYAWFAEHVGMLITGIFAVVLCLLGMSGVWLYRGFWKSFFTLRWGRSARIFFSDLHKMIGISMVGFNLILGFTGAYWNLSHVAEDGLGHHEEPADQAGTPLHSDKLSLNALSSAATSALPGFQTLWVSFPQTSKEDITLWGTVFPSARFTGRYGSSAFFDPQTGALKSSNDERQAGLWTKITNTFGPLHYGTFGGLPVKLLWSLGGLTPGILAVSGFLMWYRRRFQYSKKSLPAEASNQLATAS